MIAIQPMRRAKSALDSLRLEVLELARESAGPDKAALKERAVALGEKIHALFSDVFPKDSVTLGSMAATKRDLLVACEKVVAGYEGVMAFGEKVRLVTDAILGVGEALGRLLRELRVVWRVRKPGIMLEKRAGEAQGMELRERIREELAVMESALAGPPCLGRAQTA
jgi:hypothetical protein